MTSIFGLTSCYYIQPSQSEPHAVVDFEKGSGFLNLKGTNFVILSLNGKRPESWVPGVNSTTWRIVPGVTQIAANVWGSDRHQKGDARISFTAEQGRTYDVTAIEKPGSFDVSVTERNGKTVWRSEVMKSRYYHPTPIYIPAAS